MSRISSANEATGATPGNVSNSLQDLDLDVFLDLMLTELQNQDPLDPVENDELLAQISQIREISASDKLSETLDSVLLGQNVATAAGLIDTQVEGLTDEGLRVTGSVRNVTINDGEPQLELAIATGAEASRVEGAVEEGDYTYEVAWQDGDVTFSVRIAANTDDFGDDFRGSIRLVNLPPTSVPKQVYRTDNSGTGELKLLGPLRGDLTEFTDARSDDELGQETLTGSRQQLQFAASERVRLSNVSNIETLR